MPLSDLQREILTLLAAHRDPESYVAGATALNQEGPRFSDDIDILHDREERVARAADADAALSSEHGFERNRIFPNAWVFGRVSRCRLSCA